MTSFHAYRLTYENGAQEIVEIRLTPEEAPAYYLRRWQFGDTDEHPYDLLILCTKVEHLRTQEEPAA